MRYVPFMCKEFVGELLPEVFVLQKVSVISVSGCKHPLHDFLFVVNNQMPHTSIDQPFVDFPLTVRPLIVVCLYIRLIWQELYGVESITEKPVHKCTGLKKK